MEDVPWPISKHSLWENDSPGQATSLHMLVESSSPVVAR
jgi:hypothetical protein